MYLVITAFIALLIAIASPFISDYALSFTAEPAEGNMIYYSIMIIEAVALVIAGLVIVRGIKKIQEKKSRVADNIGLGLAFIVEIIAVLVIVLFSMGETAEDVMQGETYQSGMEELLELDSLQE